jgi:hypothetical protein
MCFQDDDEGPYYMNIINQQLHRYDEVKGKKIKKRLKHDLTEELARLGLNIRGKKDLQEMAQSQNIPIVLEEDEITEIWVGKPKGMRQVLWEHGLLDLNITYVVKLKEDDPNLDGKVEYGSNIADCAAFSVKKFI